MFCLSCQTVKAEAGCYLAGMEKRVCLNCYRNAVGTMPLPSSAPSALGGAFADDGNLAQFMRQNPDTLAETMQTVSETVAAEAAGVQEWWEQRGNRTREAKQSFWEQMPAPVQDYRNKLNQKINKAADETRGDINEVEERVKEAAGGLLKPLEDLF